MPPGELTADFTIEGEASTWNGREVPETIRAAFLDSVKPAAEAAGDDPDALFGAIAGFLGTPSYSELVGWLAEYEPAFDEPLLPEPHEIESEKTRPAFPEKAVILLDASSSMLLEADGQLKMETAKSAVRSFGRTIGQKSDVALYAYGHAGTQDEADKALSCGTIEGVYPSGKYDAETFNAAVDGVRAAGWTPLAGAIHQAREDLAQHEGDITVYVVSDGAETCGGDPVKEAAAFVKDHPGRHVDIIGFQVDAEAESQMTGGMTEYWMPSDLDLSLLVHQSPRGWESSTILHRISERATLAKRAATSEKYRFMGAADLMLEKGLIDGAMRDALNDRSTAREEAHRRILDGLEEEKRNAVNSEVERIDAKIDDYRTRMEALKKEQGS
ncbi:VWA domain-containing protein [Bhargavaea ginsengi]|uniref:vWA domain-containing protein n=1 Tax=Bhargavaea ginsengi TaxID=426757 RepID=UPI0020424BDB|nr:VWA domain-containing protein [Bhargavaea ginsengi]MCM3088695.1 VWA domain-containing protein [Bhargavaea ginsengi]